MTEQDFLSEYDPEAYPRVAVTVDVVLLSIVQGRLCTLLQRRSDHPGQGKFALPGGFVAPEEGLDQAASRILADKARIEGAWLEQLYTFGEPDRDPRMRVVTVAYYALLPTHRFEEAVGRDPSLVVASLEVAEKGGHAIARDLSGAQLEFAFDHAAILGQAIARLRGKLDYAPIAFSLLPRRFTLRELQEVHEAILGKRMAKPAFRRRMRDQRWIEATGIFETGTPYRPAELYQLKASKGD